MMKLKVYILVLFLGIAATGAAQSLNDKELKSLVDVVKMLRTPSEANFKKATNILTGDTKWTRMDETGAVRDGIECKASEKVPGFKLNRILTKVEDGRKYVSTHGDMVNGEDSRYDYSLYERALKPHAQAKYLLKGRVGRQTFVIVPFDSSAKIDASIECGDVKVKGKRGPDGTVTVVWDKTVSGADKGLNLVVKNNDASSRSFVIINHNTRKK